MCVVLAREAAVCGRFNPAQPQPAAGAGLPAYCRVKNEAELWQHEAETREGTHWIGDLEEGC